MLRSHRISCKARFKLITLLFLFGFHFKKITDCLSLIQHQSRPEHSQNVKFATQQNKLTYTTKGDPARAMMLFLQNQTIEFCSVFQLSFFKGSYCLF